jgi:hypothetical protein
VRPTLSGLTGADDLTAIEALTGTGIAARTGTNTWALRTITAGSGISVTNGDGVAGNPTIAWSGADTNLPSVLINGDFSVQQRGAGSDFTANTTSGSAVLSSVSSVANVSVGQGLAGTGIATGATIVSIDSSTQITMSANATATGTGVSITPAWHNNQFCNADRWLFLCGSGASLSASSAVFSSGAAVLTAVGSSAKKGLAQWVESAVATRLADKTVTLQAIVKAASGTPTIRCAILAWTGTADTLSTARDPVNDWTSTTYTAGNFFKSTTMTVVATGSITGSTSLQTISCSGTLPTTTTNICAMVWIDSTTITPTIAFVELFPGSATRTFQHVPRAHTLNECERFYFKTFALSQAPRVSAGAAGSNRFYTSYATGGYVTNFRQRMHRVPTITVYNTGDSQTGSFRNATDSTNLTAVAGTATDHGVVIGSAAATANKEYQFHLTADAEIS